MRTEEEETGTATVAGPVERARGKWTCVVCPARVPVGRHASLGDRGIGDTDSFLAAAVGEGNVF